MVNSTPHNPVMPPVLILKLHAINTSSVPPHCSQLRPISNYRFADKSLARRGRKQATVTEDFDVHISYL